MPKLKEPKKPFEEIVRLLKAYDLGSYRKLADVIYRSDYTAGSRLRNPGDLTLSELAMICKNGHIPADEIREAIKFS